MSLTKQWGFIAFSCLMCAVLSKAATIVNNVECSIGSQPSDTVRTTGTCRVDSISPNGAVDYARAESTVSYSINDNLNLVFRQQALASTSSIRRGYASVDNEFNIVLSTPGPARMGIIRGYALSDGPVGYMFTTVDFPGLPPYFRTGYGPGFDANGGTIYVPLGTPFQLQTTLKFASVDYASFGIEGTYRFYELDGVTPVRITEIDTPEPAAMGLAGAGAMLLALLSRRFRRN